MTISEQTQFRNLYVHVPFCSGKCTYCGFYSEPFDSQRADRFLDALEREITVTVGVQCPAPETLYVGGGTPSLLTTAQWGRLCALLHRQFDLSGILEWTVEANPGSITAATAEQWLKHGVTRVSLGAQSMNDATLARIRRRHSAAQTVGTLQFIRQAGFRRTGLDLIACLPGVSQSEWIDTLQAVVDLQPEHVSVYACSIEPGSMLEVQCREGLLIPAAEEDEREALDVSAALLTARRFEHYEISNFALPGERCLYNLNVWRGKNYIGFGPAAASRVGGERWINSADLNAYCGAWPSDLPPRSTEKLSPDSDAAERLLFNFRLSDAFSLESFADEYGTAARRLVPFWQTQLEQLALDGLVARVGECWQRTPLGICFADTIAECLLPDHDVQNTEDKHNEVTNHPDTR